MKKMTAGVLKSTASFKLTISSHNAVSPKKPSSVEEKAKTSQNFDDIYFLGSPALFFRFESHLYIFWNRVIFLTFLHLQIY